MQARALPRTLCAAFLCVGMSLSPLSLAQTADNRQPDADARRVAALLSVTGKPAPPPVGVAELKFRDFFQMPIGPRGLEPTPKLLGFDGKRVRLLGYMVNAEEPSPGPFILAPLAVSMAEQEDGPADDMPATVAFVHIQGGENWVVPYVPGLLKLTGTLSVGNQEEADGRVSAVRLLLDPELCKKLVPPIRHASAAR